MLTLEEQDDLREILQAFKKVQTVLTKSPRDVKEAIECCKRCEDRIVKLFEGRIHGGY